VSRGTTAAVQGCAARSLRALAPRAACTCCQRRCGLARPVGRPPCPPPQILPTPPPKPRPTLAATPPQSQVIDFNARDVASRLIIDPGRNLSFTHLTLKDTRYGAGAAVVRASAARGRAAGGAAGAAVRQRPPGRLAAARAAAGPRPGPPLPHPRHPIQPLFKLPRRTSWRRRLMASSTSQTSQRRAGGVEGGGMAATRLAQGRGWGG
jgi:hypothetical protein